MDHAPIMKPSKFFQNFHTIWSVIGFGLSIHFENWIWIWIANHIFVMDLDWIVNPKKMD
jgi:hypothetical protein